MINCMYNLKCKNYDYILQMELIMIPGGLKDKQQN